MRAAGSGQKQKHKQTCARRLQVRSSNSGQLTCPSLTIGQGKETNNQTTIQKEHKEAHKGFFFRMELFRPCPKNGIIIVMFLFFFLPVLGLSGPWLFNSARLRKTLSFFFGRYRMQEERKRRALTKVQYA